MSEVGRLFRAHSGQSIVDIRLIEANNPFAYYVLDRWARQAEQLLHLVLEVEPNKNIKPVTLHFLEGGNFKAVCFEDSGHHFIGFSVYSVLRVVDLFMHVVDHGKFFQAIFSESVPGRARPYSDLVFDLSTIERFPRAYPCSKNHMEASIRMAFISLEFMLWHELTHLWNGHGKYRNHRRKMGNELSRIELRTLEWEADRIAISRMMLMFRSGEFVLPVVEFFSEAFDGVEGLALFGETISTPRAYAKSALFSILLFLWHFDQKNSCGYLDKSHPTHAARSFYVTSELGRVLTHWVYDSWGITKAEYHAEIGAPTVREAILCWDEISGRGSATENIRSVFSTRYALRDLGRFEKHAGLIRRDIQRLGIA